MALPVTNSGFVSLDRQLVKANWQLRVTKLANRKISLAD
jgi:hypothetical protein